MSEKNKLWCVTFYLTNGTVSFFPAGSGPVNGKVYPMRYRITVISPNGTWCYFTSFQPNKSNSFDFFNRAMKEKREGEPPEKE